MNDTVLLSATNLKKYFPVQGGFFSRSQGIAKAVDGVDLEIRIGETLGLVGESGSGKTTLSRMVLGMIRPTEGTVTLDGRDVFSEDAATRKVIRHSMQMIFQDVYASLNPRKTVRQILSEPYLIHKVCSGRELEMRVAELLESVELTPAETYLDRFPHEFSGGQKQRVAIARAIALHPRLVVADEPVSGLDMSVRAGILELMKRFGREYNQSYLFVTHDLAIVRSLCQRVAVMYLGRIAEQAPTAALFSEPLHPYTRALLAATPVPNPRLAAHKKPALEGEVPSAVHRPAGCRLHPRCPLAVDRCRREEPELRELGPGHLVACHLA